MNEIEILSQMPIVLTKDANWHPEAIGKAGDIMVLPEDAVLVSLPMIVEVNNRKD